MRIFGHQQRDRDVSAVLSLLGFVGIIVGGIGVIKDGVHRAGLVGRKQSAWAVAGAIVVMAVGGAMAPAAPASHPAVAGSTSAETPKPMDHLPEVVTPPSPSTPPAVYAVAPSPIAEATRASPSSQLSLSSPLGPLLLMASGGDGDSWRDSGGVEYRMGLVNTPEVNECGGSTATVYRKRRLQSGFYARNYSTDTYGRRVSVIFTRSGTNLNMAMAREGIANDKYLAKFRHENTQLARELDAAFAQAKANRAGVWGKCSSGGTTTASGESSTRALAAAGGRCHPDYRTCIPIKGDGSGHGTANDLDCGDIGKVVYLRSVGRDPYRLDADEDGLGCASYR